MSARSGAAFGASPTRSSPSADKLTLDIFWLKDDSLEDIDSLPEPECARRRNSREPGGGAGAVPEREGRTSGRRADGVAAVRSIWAWSNTLSLTPPPPPPLIRAR